MRKAVLLTLMMCATVAWCQEKTWNAASPRYGATLSVIRGADIFINGSTPVEDCFDGDAHSRMVVTGTPYTFRIELMDRFPIARVAFAHSDYAAEQAAKDIEVRLDDGTVIPVTLAPRANPVPRGLQWQEFPVGRPAKIVEITVKTNHPGTVGWGAVGDIALLTTTDLDARLAVPDYDPKSPTFVKAPPFDAGTAAQVTLPPRAAKDVWPRGFLTPAELAGLKAELVKPRGKEALALLVARADAAAAITPEFPDPKGPGAQLNDRGDDLAKQHCKLAYDCGTLGMAYALTGDKRYLDGARARLLGYAQRYVDYPRHTGANRNDESKVMAQRLSEAMWLIPQLAAYDYCHDALTAGERETIEKGLIRPAVEMVRNRVPAAEVADRARAAADWRTRDPYTGESKVLGNWTNFYALATVLAGATLQDQDYIDLAAAELRENIALGIGSDGMWGEGAIGYQFFALQAMIPALDIASRHGIDLWSYRDNRAKMLFDSPLRYVYPDGTGAGIHDSTRAKLGNWSTMVYDYAWLRWHDPRHAVMVNSSPRQLFSTEAVYFPTLVYDTLPEPKAVSYPSTLFGNLGYAILRDPTKFALMDYGPHGGVHGHLDKLNLLLFSGDELGGEPRFHRYEDALHDAWTRVTVAHNTMAVDGRSQQPGTGRLLVFDATDGAQIMRAEAAELYPGVLLDRTVVVLADAVVDLYHARAARPVTCDRTLRFEGKLQGLTGAAGAPLGTRDGFQHVKVVSRVPLTNGGERTWDTPAGPLHVTVAGAPGQELITALGPDDDNLVLLRQTAAQCTFAVIYRRDGWGQPVSGVKLTTSADPRGAVVEWSQGGRTRRVRVSYHSADWSAGKPPVVVE